MTEAIHFTPDEDTATSLDSLVGSKVISISNDTINTYRGIVMMKISPTDSDGENITLTIESEMFEWTTFWVAFSSFTVAIIFVSVYLGSSMTPKKFAGIPEW